MSSLGRSKTVRGAYPVYDQKGVKASPNAKVVPSKTAPPKTAQAKGTLPTSNIKTSYKVRSEDQESNGVNAPGIATKHRDDVYTNNDDPPEETGIDDFAKSKVKNVAIDEEEDEDEERYFTDLHRKICRYCDLHGEVGHELPTWIDKAGRRDPRIRESLGKVIEGGGTLLHALVKVPPLSLAAIKTRFDQRYEAIRYILENYPELYSVRDHIDNRTVLDEAIMRFHLPKLKGLNPFVNYFVQQLPVETARQMDRDPEDEEMHMGSSLKSPIIQLISMICGPDVQGPGSLGGLLPHLSGEVLRKRDTNKNTVLHLAVRYKFACDEAEESQEILKKQIQTLIETHPDLIGVLNNNNESPYLYRVNTTQAYFDQNSGDLPLKDPLTDYLKDLCMHRPIEEAITLLYGPRSGQEHQISLNLFELSRKSRAKDQNTLTKAKLMRFLDRFHFESILQFVLIPRLQLAPEAKNPDANPGRPLKASRRNSSLNDGIGREECNEILGYLRGKGVRKIIELVVDDDQDPPHTDTIIQSLNTFDIEIFDWKKIDLCSDTIFKAAPYAHKICLYSSGNNAVLRSWSAVDGLARFTKLREVEIEVRQRIESTATTKTMIGQFRERMAENCPQVAPDQLSIRQRKNTEPTVTATSGGLGAGNAPEFVSVSINTWMSTMQNFANFIRNIPDSDLSTYRHIKVAVIDDGIDAVFNEEQFASTLKGGESFCTGPKRPPYFFSSTGHGTLMADLVQRVCPKVHLYVARLDELEGEGNRQPTPESAAKAIYWAIQQEVDIISMSWTITSKYEHIIRPAIQEADRKNILMFGAASDQGYNAASKVYPAEYPEVFCIGAAKATGRADAAAELQAKFVFPGGERSEMRITRSNDNALDHAWGSSFSTALASGLAALLLDCAELVGLGKHREAIKKRDNLDRIFTDMIREKGSKYIPVTQYFTPELAALAWDTEGKAKFKKAIKNILRPVLDQ